MLTPMDVSTSRKADFGSPQRFLFIDNEAEKRRNSASDQDQST